MRARPLQPLNKNTNDKKTKAGPVQNLDVGGDEVRVAERGRGQDEETQGETQTT